MIQGLINAAAGMSCQSAKQDVISNNLANVNTPGYKRKTASFYTVLDQVIKNTTSGTTTGNAVIKQAGHSVPVMSISQDDRPGALISTGVSTNLAIDGNGAFVTQSQNGEILSRNGNFHVDSAGTLVNSQDLPVLGQQGHIKITGSQWTVDPNGDVRSGGSVVDKLRIETAPGVKADAQSVVKSGSIEGSNVNVVEEMVSMITGLRSYETCQKTIQSIDQTLDKVINQIRI